MNDNKVFGRVAQEALLIMLVMAAIGALFGWLMGSSSGQTFVASGLGGLLGILTGAFITAIRIRSNSATTRHSSNPNGDERDEGTYPWPDHTTLAIRNVRTKDEVPLQIRVFLQYDLGEARTGPAPVSSSSSTKTGGVTTDPTNAVHALVEASTREVIRQMTIEAVDNPKGLLAVENRIVEDVNTELKSLGAEVGLLVVQEISLTDEVAAAKQAAVVNDLRDEARRQAEAARVEAVQGQLRVISEAYARAKDLASQQRRQHQYVLLQSLLDLKRQPGASDVWTASLDELMNELEQVRFPDTRSI